MQLDRSHRLWSLQYLRAAAALLVVAHHARNPRAGLYNPLSDLQFGQAGVDIFFVISGFVMYAMSRDECVAVFIRRRIVRIVPMYWIATLLILALRFGRYSLSDPAFDAHIAKSLLFIPHYSYEYPAEIWPYVIPGWTLNYEMLFYAIFGVGVALGRVLLIPAMMLLALVAAGLLFAGDGAIWRSYTDPLLLEFLLGMAIARWPSLTSQSWSWVLLPAGTVALVASSLVEGPRLLIWGLPAAMIVGGALAIERRGGLGQSALLKALGDASYSIYLFQFPATWLVNALAARSPSLWPIQLAERMIGSLLAAALLGLAIHLLVERRLQRWLSGRRPVADGSVILAGP
jgi:exopolysaccharide production protein ExoZ